MKNGLLLAAIILLGGALRIAGIHWGLPDATHPTFSYHPDEALHVDWAEALARGDLIPKQFIYGGTLTSTILNADRHFGAALHPLLGGANPLADTIIAGRYFIVLLSLLTILLVYETGKTLWDAPSGLLAALIVALTPVHVFMAQDVRPDESATFVVTLIVYLSALIFRADARRDRRFVVYAGLALGAAVALRFPLATFGLAPVAAWLLRDPPSNVRAAVLQLVGQRSWVLAGAMLLGYCVASPHTLIYFSDAINGIGLAWAYEVGVFPDAAERGPGIWQYGWTQLREAFGIPLHLFALAAIVHALVRRSREQILLLAAFVPYFVLTTFASWVVVRYTVPMVPPLALLITAAAIPMLRASSAWRAAALAALTGSLTWTLLSDVAFARIEKERNVREEAADWIADHAPPKSGVATTWQYPTDVYLNPVIRGDVHVYAVMADRTAALAFSSGDVDYLVVNESVYKNMERLGDRHPSEAIREFHHALDSAPYHLVAEFQKPVRFAGLDFSSTFTSQDYAIVNPGIRVYQRDAANAQVK